MINRLNCNLLTMNRAGLLQKLLVFTIFIVTLYDNLCDALPAIILRHQPLFSSFGHEIDSFYTKLIRHPREAVDDDDSISKFVLDLFTDRITQLYVGITFCVLFLFILINWVHSVLEEPFPIYEEDPTLATAAGAISPTSTHLTDGLKSRLRLRFGGWSREFVLGQDELMIEFINADKKRNRFIVTGPMLAKSNRTPTYMQPDQRSLVCDLIFKKTELIQAPPSVRIRLENSQLTAGLFVYSIELLLPHLNSIAIYAVYTTLYGGARERVDAVFKQTACIPNTKMWSPTNGITYLEIGLFCYCYSCFTFFFHSFQNGAKMKELRIDEAIKQGFFSAFIAAIYGGCIALVFAKWIRKNYVYSSGAFYWMTMRLGFLITVCIFSNILGFIGVYKLHKLFAHSPPQAFFTSAVILSGISNAFLIIWLGLGYATKYVLHEEMRYLRSRVIDSSTAIPATAQQSSGLRKSSKSTTPKRKIFSKMIKIISPSPELEADQAPKEISLKELVAKQMAARGTLLPAAKGEALMPGPAIAAAAAAAAAASPPTGGVHHTTSKDSLGNDYYDMMTAKGKVTSISQYFSGAPKMDKETLDLYKKGTKDAAALAIEQPVAAVSAAPSAVPSTALTAPVPKQTPKGAKRTQSSSSVASTGSDYYAAMIKEGKIPKIGSISQYGALLK